MNKIILTGIDGAASGKEYILEKEITNIGRSDMNEIILEDLDMSRKHAQIKLIDNKVIIVDCNSTNGVLVNGTLMKESVLNNNDILKLGNCVLKIIIAEQQKQVKEESTQYVHIKPVEPVETPAEPESTGMTITKIREILSTVDKKEWKKESITKAYKNLFVLYQLSKAMSTCANTDELLGLVMDIVFQLLSADSGYLMFLDERTRELIPKAVKYRSSEQRFSVSRTITNRVIDEKVAVVTQDATLDSQFKDSESVIRQTIRSAICVPIITRKKTIGLIYLDSHTKTGVFTENDIDVLLTIANQSAIAIENMKLVENIQEERQIKSNLERYLSPELVKQIIEKKKSIALGGIQQKITVVFTDIRGFTALSETLPADVVVKILNEHFSQIVETLFKYNGLLDKFIGDGLIAIFGIPSPTGKDVEQAVLCALEMQNRVRETNPLVIDKHRVNLEVGIGINTGFAVVGNIGSDRRMEYTVIGDVVNTAARIVASAIGSEILINESTYNEACNLVKTELLDPVKVKGKTEPLRLYRIIGLKKNV